VASLGTCDTAPNPSFESQFLEKRTSVLGRLRNAEYRPRPCKNSLLNLLQALRGPWILSFYTVAVVFGTLYSIAPIPLLQLYLTHFVEVLTDRLHRVEATAGLNRLAHMALILSLKNRTVRKRLAAASLSPFRVVSCRISNARQRTDRGQFT
jgi:hypothetical protein